MEQISFVFTVFFMLLGPIKLIPSFAGVMRDSDLPRKRSVAVWGLVFAVAVCLFVALAGGALVDKYHVSINALRFAAGTVLVISALMTIFQKAPPPVAASESQSAVQIAASPIAVPNILAPAAIAAILIFMMLASQYPGIELAVAICIAVILALDFLVMYFIDSVSKIPGLAIVLTVLGSVLVFVQLAFAFEIFLAAIRSFQAGQ